MKLLKLLKNSTVVLASLLVMNCGSSGTSTTGTTGGTSGTVTTTQQAQSTAFVQSTFTNAMTSLGQFGSSSNISATLILDDEYEIEFTEEDASGVRYLANGDVSYTTLDCSAACTSGGTCSLTRETSPVEFVELAYNNCSSVTITSDGSMRFEKSGTTITVTATNFTSQGSDYSFATSGSYTITEVTAGTEYTSTFNNYSTSITSGSNTFTSSMDGSMTINSTAGTINGSFTLTVNGTNITCTFTNFNVNTATSTDWQNACPIT